jgi:hypothetical protein
VSSASSTPDHTVIMFTLFMIVCWEQPKLQWRNVHTKFNWNWSNVRSPPSFPDAQVLCPGPPPSPQTPPVTCLWVQRHPRVWWAEKLEGTWADSETTRRSSTVALRTLHKNLKHSYGRDLPELYSCSYSICSTQRTRQPTRVSRKIDQQSLINWRL